MAKYENGHFYTLPKYLHNVVSSTYQLAILTYLLQCENKDEAWPSYNKMAQGLMSRWKAIRCIHELIDKGYITKTTNAFHSNTYSIVMDKLVSDTDQYALPPSKPHTPPVVSDTYRNNNKLNNTKEQKEGIRILSSSFKKINHHKKGATAKTPGLIG